MHQDRSTTFRRIRCLLGSSVLLLALVAMTGCTRGDGRLDLALRPAERTEQSIATTTTPRSSLAQSPSRRIAIDPNEQFDADRALADAKAIANLGVKAGGSAEEAQAADYIVRRLEKMGYEARIETFRIPNGKTSRNVIASRPGALSTRTIILGAHFDSKPPSPGANDNASGCGVVLELARLLRSSPAEGEVLFVFYGSEEYLDDGPGDNHHLGSRHHASRMSGAEVARTAAMISVDMVGFGTKFHVRSMLRGPRTLVNHLLAEGRRRSVAMTFEKDLGATGWSDHEPYERRGVPVAWLHWQDDPVYHTAGDDADHVQKRPIEITGDFLLGVIRDLDSTDLERFCDR